MKNTYSVIASIKHENTTTYYIIQNEVQKNLPVKIVSVGKLKELVGNGQVNSLKLDSSGNFKINKSFIKQLEDRFKPYIGMHSDIDAICDCISHITPSKIIDEVAFRHKHVELMAGEYIAGSANMLMEYKEKYYVNLFLLGQTNKLEVLAHSLFRDQNIINDELSRGVFLSWDSTPSNFKSILVGVNDIINLLLKSGIKVVINENRLDKTDGFLGITASLGFLGTDSMIRYVTDQEIVEAYKDKIKAFNKKMMNNSIESVS